jgi:putative NADH-flavin reductase
MKISIFGATGRTGQQLVVQSVELGHSVTVFVRNPAKLSAYRSRLTVIQGDVLDSKKVDDAVKEQDAVLSALGSPTLKKNNVLSTGTKNILESMMAHGVHRLVCESSLGVGDSREQPGFLFRWFFLPLVLKHAFADKEVQERYIRESAVDWIIVRPGYLTDAGRTSDYKVGFSPADRSIKGKISRADVAEFMLSQITDNTFVRKTPGISY